MCQTVNLLPDDYRWYYRYATRHFQNIHSVLIGHYVLLTAVGQFGVGREANWEWRLITQAVATVIVVAVWLGVGRSVDRQLEKFKLPVGEHQYEISANGICVSNGNGTSEIFAHAVREARETKEYFLIVLHNATALIIPKRDVADAAGLRVALDSLGLKWVT